jgi:hypothetical protein
MTLDEARALKKGTVIVVKTPWGADQEPVLVNRWDEAAQRIMVLLPFAVQTNVYTDEWPIAYETARVEG